MATLRFGIDLGGTKIEILGLLVLEDGTNKVVYQKRIATPKGDYHATVQAIAQLVLDAENELKSDSQLNPIINLPGLVGVGIPGAISSKTGKVKNANSTWLIGEDLQGDLQNALSRPVQLANDANCFALSEAVDGAASGSDIVFGVIIGTGCGGGVVVNGQILNGVNAIAGEWGHNPLPWQTASDVALACYCGLNGCNETFLSGSGFEQHFLQRTGLAKTAEQIVALSEQGDVDAEQLMQDYMTWLAKGLASVINILDPDVIVLGGGMSNIERIYREVPKLWHNWVFSDAVDTQLKPPKFGDASGVRGAAWL
ncbi:fructokinase [Thiomicrorhabdus immobilis]|uniref:Fructokinase n=1 Tax=Thiomicrorhabdus immobilis TaxID=2791037 RepID=A0ABM7MCT2_9GAMM|nr:ROK family protein [Thiomicrorhabdus immobilis]BCN93130.1 fructokinase [Thiomicrorhabdus immobilis]